MDTTSSQFNRSAVSDDYVRDTLHSDPCRDMSSAQVTEYISKIIQKRTFGDLYHHAVNQNTCQETMSPVHDGVSENQRIRNLAFHNKELPVKINYHIPEMPKGVTGFDHLCHGKMPEKVTTDGYNEMHPLRSHLPVRGPGTSNLASPATEESYLRVAGALSIAASEFVELSLPRHIPVMIDVIIYHMQLSLNLPSAEERRKVINQGLEYCKKYLTHLTTFVAAQQAAVTDETMNACNQYIREKLGPAFGLIKMAVKRRAELELAGEGGVVLPASKMLYMFLSKTKSTLFQELSQKYQEIATLISFEALSYAKAMDVIDTNALRKVEDKTSFTVEVTQPIPEIVKDIQNVNSIERSVATYDDLKGSLRPNHGLRVNFLDVRLGKTKIVLNVTTHFDPKNLSENQLLNYKRTDRSNIHKSEIEFAPIGEFLLPKDHRKKLNGFQYSLTHNCTTNENTIMARYPQAPQITMFTDSLFSFQMNVEVYALENHELRASLISLYYIGPYTTNHPDYLALVRTLSQFFTFEINNTVLWDYTKHDGVIFNTKIDTYYLKPDRECDLFYHPREERPGRFVLTYERGNEVIRENTIGSRLLVKHLENKPEKYLVNLKKRARDAYFNFKKKLIKQKDFYVGSQDWYAETSDQFKADLESSVKDFPKVEECYNVPIVHHNYRHTVTRDYNKKLTAEQMFDISEAMIRPTTERVEKLETSIGGYAKKLKDDDFSM